MNAPLPAGLQSSLFGTAQRLHIQHGPTDLVIDADGPGRLALFELAVDSMRDVLEGLVQEMTFLREPWEAAHPPSGAVAHRMHQACAIAGDRFVTPMAAVAGAIADHVLATMMTSPHATTTKKISVNNGGDIAFWTGAGATTIASIAGPLHGAITLTGPTEWRGMATSGHCGRSLSLGIADSVTVLADCAATADVAATLIAGSVDCPDVSQILRRPANEIDPESDLGNRPVTITVPPLDPKQIENALAAGHDQAIKLMRGGKIGGAVLELQGKIVVAGLDEPAALLRTG